MGKRPNPLEHLLRRWLRVPPNTKKERCQLPGITPISLLNSAADSVLFRCFQPLCGCFFTRNFYCQMREPAVLCCAMPMLHAGRNVYAVTRLHRNRFLAPFLIPSSAPDTDQNLAAAAFGMMDMPVVLTARLKGNIVDSDLRSGNRC